MNEKFLVDNKKYTLCGFHGKVVDQQTSAESYANSGSSSGGGYSSAYSNAGVYNTKNFFLVNSKGEEMTFSFTDKAIPVIRTGHMMQVMWLKREKQESGHYVFVRNVTLNESYLDEQMIKQIYTDKKVRILGFLITIPAIFLIGTGLLFSFLGLLEFLTSKSDATTYLSTGIIAILLGFFIIIYLTVATRKKQENLSHEVLKRRI